MFLGKWNSDNSYYLYEQIKALFYEAAGTAVFIRGGWQRCPAVRARSKARSPCGAGGSSRGAYPGQGSGGSSRAGALSPRLSEGPEPLGQGRGADPSRRIQRQQGRGEPGAMTLGPAAAPARAQGCSRTNSVLYSCTGEPLQCPISFPKLCSYCRDADPASAASGCSCSLHTQHF